MTYVFFVFQIEISCRNLIFREFPGTEKVQSYDINHEKTTTTACGRLGDPRSHICTLGKVANTRRCSSRCQNVTWAQVSLIAVGTKHIHANIDIYIYIIYNLIIICTDIYIYTYMEYLLAIYIYMQISLLHVSTFKSFDSQLLFLEDKTQHAFLSPESVAHISISVELES